MRKIINALAALALVGCGSPAVAQEGVTDYNGWDKPVAQGTPATIVLKVGNEVCFGGRIAEMQSRRARSYAKQEVRRLRKLGYEPRIVEQLPGIDKRLPWEKAHVISLPC